MSSWHTIFKFLVLHYGNSLLTDTSLDQSERKGIAQKLLSCNKPQVFPPKQQENLKIDDNWWIGIILEKNAVECDITMKFMHPKGPSEFFFWPQRDDICFIPNHCILKIIDVPNAIGSARKYSISKNDEKQIHLKWKLYQAAIMIN